MTEPIGPQNRSKNVQPLGAAALHHAAEMVALMNPGRPHPLPGFTGCTHRDPDHCACATDEDVTCSTCGEVIEPGEMVQSVQWPEYPGIPLDSTDQDWTTHTMHAGACP